MTNFSGPLQDRQLIRELFGAYSDATFRRDVDAWLSCYATEGVWVLMGKEIRGKDELRSQWSWLWSTLERMAFFTEIGAIQVEGDRASARSYCREILHYQDGSMRKVIGSYEDQLVSRGGAWLFARRDYRLLTNEGAILPAGTVCSGKHDLVAAPSSSG
jgi:ketosteroid isomerase-like protein